MAKSIHSLFFFVKKQRTIERKKKRSKISALESCYANIIYVLIGVELRPYGQKLVQFCKHTDASKLVVEIFGIILKSTHRPTCGGLQSFEVPRNDFQSS